MRRWIMIVAGALLLAGSVRAQPTLQAAMRPEGVTLRWLEPGQLLVRWTQRSSADTIQVATCRTADVMTCTITTTLRHRMAGEVQLATTWGQPGNVVYLWEYNHIPPNTYDPLGGAVGPFAVPPYPTYLPVLR